MNKHTTRSPSPLMISTRWRVDCSFLSIYSICCWNVLSSLSENGVIPCCCWRRFSSSCFNWSIWVHWDRRKQYYSQPLWLHTCAEGLWSHLIEILYMSWINCLYTVVSDNRLSPSRDWELLTQTLFPYQMTVLQSLQIFRLFQKK